MSYQKLVLVGNVGKDGVDMKYTAGGQAVSNFSLASNRKYTNSNGEKIEETTWFKIAAWGRQAETCNQYLEKGSRVLVEGRLTPDKETGGPRVWESNGKHGASYELTADRVVFLSGAVQTAEEELF